VIFINLIDEELHSNDYLIDFLTGEMKNIITRFEMKIKERERGYWPEGYYDTNRGISYQNAYVKSNWISDPTGNRAAHLADLSSGRDELYQFYVKLHERLKNRVKSEGIEKRYLHLLKVWKKTLPGNFTEITRENDISYEVARRKVREIEKMLIDVIEKYVKDNELI